MAFVRTVKRENPFVQLDKTFFEDPNLQWESKGLLGYILSRPDDWKVNQSDLTNRSAGGKSKVETALLDLMANGYVHWYAVRKENGQIEEWVYDVYERPEFNPKKEECIAEGKRRIAEKKAKNKRKNEKAREKQPETDNPKVDEPEADNPEVDNPEVDNPVYTNIDFTDIDLTNIKEEEENLHSELINFLISKDITLENALKFETRLLREQITGYTNDDVFEAIKLSFTDFVNGDCNDPYTWAVGKLQRLLDAKTKSVKNKPRKGKTSKQVKTELLPDWFDENENKKVSPAKEINVDHETTKGEIEAKQKEIEEMLTKLRS